ncbi:MAG: AbrB/MazE/SpoVT family DNA-binding domain-containing protein [Candidatus Absconditabacteria bacterium]|nr:AbrB/MazE/SpoVT family DNA-binding domain-containing protein [Candidatus Absconditabacteria bacterium]
MIYTLKSFNTGQITLPKKWRDKFKTSIFTAEERNGGLFIKPIVEDSKQVVYYENKEGFGIFSPDGLDPEQLISQIKQIQNG